LNLPGFNNINLAVLKVIPGPEIISGFDVGALNEGGWERHEAIPDDSLSIP
jgi:hypothetical protein